MVLVVHFDRKIVLNADFKLPILETLIILDNHAYFFLLHH